ncbi:putative protein kinase RLK-Pelle-DLSV family [Helianthus annuus]|uniref:Putative mitogen-activated protein kinase kinase kinase 12/13 n=1 Tax=Helianthus annuus TaxID=4232 RepID=A0A251UAN7_HELAN|nr:putative protein kinase RLK-Pelle-DLSV family [Helianthus annuus]KAJ0501313.1 putative protein kinase RLK-Pelle-DLSV family [Helianthus annuus]KAJ0517220.1 putative protein kinase RLK-Pelle-DLSV family [Helianthus annuus]KAJ0685229.1 putative protein kinase RLK-Pelle-DLSV family [Helianthus annuus]KAJ0689137.1 putative protein kinase RLK-Pelle-DLSV family [Helianthus annuus]
MAPEYALRGHLSDKADVYSYGVLLLEIISGKNNTSYVPINGCICLLVLLLTENVNCLCRIWTPRSQEHANTNCSQVWLLLWTKMLQSSLMLSRSLTA